MRRDAQRSTSAARRWTKGAYAVVVGGAVGASAVATACIIAQPAMDLPSPVRHRPTILRDRAVPPSSAVLGYFPDTFYVDVEVDPNAAFQWRLFVDYDPTTGAGLVGAGGFAADPNAGSVRTALPLDTALLGGAKPSTNQCHVIEGLVAFAFEGVVDGRGAHTFDEDAGGGDSIVWIYSPTGDLSGCPLVEDAGISGDGPSTSDAPPVLPGDGGLE